MIIIKKTLTTLSILAPLTFGSIAYASTVPSDFSQDVKDGTAQLSSDSKAQAQANEVKDGENVDGQVDDGQVSIDETVGAQENNMDSSQSGESHDAQDKVDNSTSNDTGATTTGNESQSN